MNKAIGMDFRNESHFFPFLCVLKADGLMSVHKRRCPCSGWSTSKTHNNNY